jgi:hypothetical protein
MKCGWLQSWQHVNLMAGFTNTFLIGGLEHFSFFRSAGNVIITDELHHFSEG